MSSRRFRSEVFCLNIPSDAQRYEAIKQDALVDKTGRFEIVSENGHWEQKTGERFVALEYTERDDGPGAAPERW